MSQTEILEQIRRMPAAQQRELAEQIWAEFGDHSDELTRDEIAELDRRAEDALKHPGRGRPWPEVSDEVLRELRK